MAPYVSHGSGGVNKNYTYGLTALNRRITLADMKYARKIVARFGGIRPMARFLGVSPAVVQYLDQVGHIPAKRHGEVMRIARAKGIRLRPADFFDSAA